MSESESINSRTATIMWEDGPLPNPVNPPIVEYEVFLNGSSVGTTEFSESRTFILTSLTPFTNYIVTVRATNRVGNSEMSQPYVFNTMEERKSLHNYSVS